MPRKSLGTFLFRKNILFPLNFLYRSKLLYIEKEVGHVEAFSKKAQKGDKEALLKLVLDYKDDYYRLAYTYVENKHDAMDALENMIVILYEKINQLQISVLYL